MDAKPIRFLKAGTTAALIAAIATLHYFAAIEQNWLQRIIESSCYIALILGGAWFEITGGLLVALGLSAFAAFDWFRAPAINCPQYTQIPLYFAAGILAGYFSSAQRKARESLEKSGADMAAAYKKLNDTFNQLRHSDRLASLARLSAGIAHEIRNPLASILGAVEILGEGASASDPKSEFAQIARKEVARLEKLTRDIVQFSKPSPPQKLKADPQEVIEEACRSVGEQARKQNIEIVQCYDQMPATIVVDTEQLRQAIINILLSSLQAQCDGKEIIISSKTQGDEWIASIQCPGHNLSEDKLDRIFDPFFSIKGESGGLGLSISHQLIKSNGGRIWAESQPGHGACLLVSFPLQS
jgi:signal transduction histidine kinase